MTKQKSTKRALLLSALSLLMCVSMLIGSTFAWFTDSVTSAGNKIQSGTLKLDLELLDKDSEKWNSIKESKAPIFNYDLWEPGYTEIELLKVENEGTLALKWMAKFVCAKKLTALANVIDVYVLPYGVQADASGVTYPADRELTGYTKVGTVADFVNTIQTTTTGNLEAGEAAYLGIALKMQETAGNEYQGLDLGAAFDIQILATQYTSESDSFNNQYDADAAFENVVDSGTCGGIDWTLGEHGTLTVSPSANPAVDANCGKVFNPGQWREAVIYNSKGEGILEGFNAPDASANEGGYFCDRNAVKALVIEEGVTSIGSFAAQFPNLTGEVVIPASVTYIGQEAFHHSTMTKITFAKVPEGQTGQELCIAQGAFKDLIVEDFALPDDRPVHVHVWQFLNSAKLKNITFPTTLTGVTSAHHVDYLGDPNKTAGAGSGSSAILNATNSSLETITFGSQAVRDLVIRVDNSFIKNYGAAYITSPEGSLIYCKSLAVAAEHAQSGDTITLLKNTNEAVELPAGVALVENGFIAENVIVK